MKWLKLCNSQELQLVGTLNGGQSFRWKLDEETREWTGVFSKTVWKLREKDNFIEYGVLGSLLHKEIKSKTHSKFKEMLEKYFRLDVKLASYYAEWAGCDELFKSACEKFYGIRMLAQEPVENLLSFICSQNNHISRISSMVEKLCSVYGEQICEDNNTTYYSFPEIERLKYPKVMLNLRDLGFGYRAKYIQKSAEQVEEFGGDMWLDSLKDMTYADARKELMKLAGIGPKVADCICLMSLNHLESVPVDTHVYQIAAQNYLPHLRGKKTVTDSMYAEIAGHFRKLYGPMAGWAHTVLFCADLKKFQAHTDLNIKVKSTKTTKTNKSANTSKPINCAASTEPKRNGHGKTAKRRKGE